MHSMRFTKCLQFEGLGFLGGDASFGAFNSGAVSEFAWRFSGLRHCWV